MRPYAALAALLLLNAGCAAPRDRIASTESMLAAAGFRAEPADTPERRAELQSLTPHQVLMQKLEVGDKPGTGYAYADPEGCDCVYIGDAKAYQAYEKLLVQKKIADEHLRAAQLERDARFNWGLWGPGILGPGPVVVVRR
jgi:hypothetical protein